MYFAVVMLTMLVLPGASVAIEHAMHPEAGWLALTGKWFVFWGVGIRLGLAGMRQVLQPAFTARAIFHIEGDEPLPLVRELGLANCAAALVALLSLWRPDFTLPAAIWAAMFYAGAGLIHVATPHRSRNETIAMVSDLWLAAVLANYAVWAIAV